MAPRACLRASPGVGMVVYRILVSATIAVLVGMGTTVTWHAVQPVRVVEHAVRTAGSVKTARYTTT